MPPRPRFDGSTSTRDRKRSALRKKGGPDKVDNFSVGLAVPFCMGGAEIITNMVLIEPPVLEHFDADPVGTAAERRQWVGDTAWRIGGATSAAHFFLAKSGNYLKAFDSVIKGQGAREVFEGDDQDYLRFESPPSAAADALARVAWEQKISTERYAEEFGKLLEHNFGASGFVPPERCAQGITETHISTRLMVEALRADMTVLTLLARKDKETNVKDKDEELEKRVLSRQAADEVAAAAAADEARERAKTIAAERAMVAVERVVLRHVRARSITGDGSERLRAQQHKVGLAGSRRHRWARGGEWGGAACAARSGEVTCALAVTNRTMSIRVIIHQRDPWPEAFRGVASACRPTI